MSKRPVYSLCRYLLSEDTAGQSYAVQKGIGRHEADYGNGDKLLGLLYVVDLLVLTHLTPEHASMHFKMYDE